MYKLILIAFIFFLTGLVYAQTQPHWLWAICADNPYPSTCEISSVTTDSAGSIYIIGYFTGTVALGNTTLTAISTEDILLAKLDPQGNWIWIKGAGGTGTDEGHAIACNNGHVFVTGTKTNPVTFDS